LSLYEVPIVVSVPAASIVDFVDVTFYDTKDS
jgi:hypothetical protein